MEKKEWKIQDYMGLMLAIAACLGFLALVVPALLSRPYPQTSPIYHNETITAIIAYKYTETTWHITSIAPIIEEAPETTYYFLMSNNDTIAVPQSDYNAYDMGMNYTYVALR